MLLVLLQEPLPSELFDLLVLTLCRQAPAFATSLSYAKLVTAVLTTYSSQVSAALQPLALNGSLSPRGALQFHICSPRSSAHPTAAVWRQLWMAAMQP